MKDAAILSPYPIPAQLAGKKRRNVGDGFILRAIERRVGRFEPAQVLSPRISPDPASTARLQKARTVLIGGANQLNANYTIWPGLNEQSVVEFPARLIPFGVGLNGEPDRDGPMSETTRALLRSIHQRIEFSSWRCPDTVAYLTRELPELAPQCLMTGCPVIYDAPILGAQALAQGQRTIAVTVTDRGDFWNRESAFLTEVARVFRSSQRILVLHQNFSPPARFEAWRRWRHDENWSGWQHNSEKLRALASRLGYKIVIPESCDDAIAFYDTVDLHIGSRLHAHLLFLSRAKRSFLIPVDGRAPGMARHFNFPLCQPGRLEEHLQMDFEAVRSRIIDTYNTMQRFLQSL